MANGKWTKLEGRTLVNEQHVQYAYCIAKILEGKTVVKQMSFTNIQFQDLPNYVAKG